LRVKEGTGAKDPFGKELPTNEREAAINVNKRKILSSQNGPLLRVPRNVDICRKSPDDELTFKIRRVSGVIICLQKPFSRRNDFHGSEKLRNDEEGNFQDDN
jgi:hypothetical protein